MKHLLQIAPEGLRATDGLEQFWPQALGFAPPPTACPPAAPDKVKSQQTEEDDCEPHSKPQQAAILILTEVTPLALGGEPVFLRRAQLSVCPAIVLFFSRTHFSHFVMSW